jgi:kynurenine formamidase
MRIRSALLGCLFMLSAILVSSQAPRERAEPLRPKAVVDLTHTLNGQTPTYEESKTPAFQARTVATIQKDHYFAREISLPEHFGTHLDAPAHFAPGHWTVDEIPPERLVAPLIVIDVRSRVNGNPDYQMSQQDLSDWEQREGPIPAGSVVIARTGWESRWNSAKDYRNPDTKGVMHFPGYSLPAAQFLVDRKVFGLGIDTLSIDYGPSPDFPVHQYTLAHNLYHLENVANLDRVSPSGAMVVVAPMKLEGGSGCPVRILALLR